MTRYLTIIAIAAVALANGEERFDMKVRGDFFAGFAGDKEAMARALKNTEAILSSNPKHAEALVWHGAGLVAQSGQRFREGDNQTGAQLFARGQKEMDDAVALDPNNLGVRIPRGAVLLSAGRAVFASDPERGRPVIAKAVADYEFAYDIQKDHLATMGQHPAGELLFGIADANSRLGNADRAAEFFDRVENLLPDSAYAKRAAVWKQTRQPLPMSQSQCVGCHTAAVK